jgi:acyl carrier protein
MDFETVLQQVTALAREQFSADRLEIDENTSASDIAAWNSLNHVMLVASIEKSFGIKFDLLQMIEMKTIGDLARATFKMVK